MLFRSYGITLTVLSIVAGLVSFIVAALIASVVRRLRRGDLPSKEPDASESNRHSFGKGSTDVPKHSTKLGPSLASRPPR